MKRASTFEKDKLKEYIHTHVKALYNVSTELSDNEFYDEINTISFRDDILLDYVYRENNELPEVLFELVNEEWEKIKTEGR